MRAINLAHESSNMCAAVQPIKTARRWPAAPASSQIQRLLTGDLELRSSRCFKKIIYRRSRDQELRSSARASSWPSDLLFNTPTRRGLWPRLSRRTLRSPRFRLQIKIKKSFTGDHEIRSCVLLQEHPPGLLISCSKLPRDQASGLDARAARASARRILCGYASSLRTSAGSRRDPWCV